MRFTATAAACCAIALVLPACAKKESVRKDVPQYTIKQFYGNKQIFGGAFSPDEGRLLVTSNESGIYNVYEITIADSARKPVTASTVESFFGIDYVPSTGDILYSADKGGNEIDHIYLLAKEGSHSGPYTRPQGEGDGRRMVTGQEGLLLSFQQAESQVLRPLPHDSRFYNQKSKYDTLTPYGHFFTLKTIAAKALKCDFGEPMRGHSDWLLSLRMNVYS